MHLVGEKLIMVAPYPNMAILQLIRLDSPLQPAEVMTMHIDCVPLFNPIGEFEGNQALGLLR